MKTVTIRDLRQRWPETEKALQVEHEIIITRDSKPVAKLVRIAATQIDRPEWDPDEHRRWMRKTWGRKLFRFVDDAIAQDRSDQSNHPRR